MPDWMRTGPLNVLGVPMVLVPVLLTIRLAEPAITPAPVRL